MKKGDRIASFVRGLEADPDSGVDPCYAGYFTCFNDQRYYEAHDVLEQLWLREKNADHLFYKGLIQIAGAFVHLQKQFLRPGHPKDAGRLRPAVRLFRLGIHNLEPFRPVHLHLNVEELCRMCEARAAEITASEFTVNPWHPTRAPRVELES